MANTQSYNKFNPKINVSEFASKHNLMQDVAMSNPTISFAEDHDSFSTIEFIYKSRFKDILVAWNLAIYAYVLTDTRFKDLHTFLTICEDD